MDEDALLAAVIASSLDAIVVADEEGLVVAFNHAAETTFGYTRAEALGRPIGDLIVPGHMRAAHERGMARYRRTNVPHVLGRRIELEAQRKDGTIFPVELTVTEASLPDRRLFAAHLRDLSEARRIADEVERQREALRQSEKLAAFGSLLAGVAHELNNPLSIVLGQSVLLLEDAAREGDPQTLARAGKIQSAAERCARIVRSFLAIARRRKAERAAHGIGPILDGVVDLLAYGLRASGVEVLRDERDGGAQALVDPDQVHQILVNLVLNAAQAMEGSPGRRRILVETTREGDALRILVADEGPGVPPEIADRVFEPFFTTKPQGYGAGIGLSVSRGLAETQGGRLELAASPLGGAAFALTLPLADSGAAAPEAAPAEAAAPAPGHAGRVLVVDDEPEVAALVAEALARAGFSVDVAEGGRAAQAALQAPGAAYDAIVCDLRMPEVDGPALFAWVKERDPALAERMAFVTGDALGPAAGRFLARSGCPVLEKPFAPTDVVRLVLDLPPRGG